MIKTLLLYLKNLGCNASVEYVKMLHNSYIEYHFLYEIKGVSYARRFLKAYGEHSFNVKEFNRVQMLDVIKTIKNEITEA